MSSHSLRPFAAAPVADRKVRFAIVGCGRIAANHMESIKTHAERAELVAVCDTDPAKLAAAVERTGAKGYADLAAMLAPARLAARRRHRRSRAEADRRDDAHLR